MERFYLDANSSCPPLKEAQEAVAEIVDKWGNPSSFHEEGRYMRMIIDNAREEVAKSLLAQSKEIIFTSGASEANRWFADAIIKKSLRERKKLSVVMSPFEHASLFKPMMAAHDDDFIDLFILNINELSEIDIDENKIKSCDVFIMCQAHNESGIIPNLTQALAYTKTDTIVMSDISQSYSRLDPPLNRIDFASFSAHKIGGYPGAGGFLIRGNAKSLNPLWLGGSQERDLRPGTESTILLKAMGKAVSQIDRTKAQYQAQASWRDFLEEEISKVIPVKIIGKHLSRLPNTSFMCFYKENPDALRIAFDLNGLSVGFGSACSGLAPSKSPLLTKIGIDEIMQKTCVRFSFPPNLLWEDLRTAKDILINRIITHKLLS